MLALLFASDREDLGGSPADRSFERANALPSDAVLLARIQSGDAPMFETLFRAYAERLVAFVIHYLHARADAEDVVQEVFLRIWRNHATWQVRGTVNDYLYLACRNMVRNRIARQVVARRGQAHILADETDRAAESGIDVPPIDERHAELIRAIDELPARRREICLLRWREGLSYADVARRLGVSEKTVENQLARAFKTLKTRLAGPATS